MTDWLMPTPDEYKVESEKPTDDLAAWLEEVETAILLSRSLMDVLTWLKDAKGPNVAQLRDYVRTLHQAALVEQNRLGQRAFMLWGMNVPSPKGLKERE